VDAISWSDDSRAVLAEAPWGTTTQMLRLGLDGTMTKLTDVNGVISDVSVHDGRRAYVYESLTEPPELYADGRRLTHHTDAFRQRQLGETRLIRWKNPKDGLEIEGLLTLPVGYSARNAVPLLTFVHGGPASRFDQSFLGYLGNVYATQVFAAKGYAILRPNPRGSNGYGVAFRRLNMRDWGGMDWLDVNAGIDKLIADGIADPKRLGLMGWSYGGYLSAWALAQSDRFAAVSAGAGMSDLLMMQATSDTHGYVAAYFPGMPLDLLRDRSPAWQLKKKPNAKILIQQGENDERVPLSQGTLLYRRLRDLGADVTMVTYPRSGHSIREPRLRLDVMKRNVELFTSVIPATR
jgi:dipeptidyl aminopeptidase/acylaminoacyl peptidase